MSLPPLLSNGNFLKLWISQAFSIISISIVNYLLLLKLFQQTNSTLAVSFIWIAYSLPALLVGPFAATLVDLSDRKVMLAITNFLQAITILLLIPIKTKLFLIYGVVFIYSFLNQFYLPAESSSLPALVPSKNLPQANGLFFLTKQAGSLIGIGLAGFLHHFFSVEFSLILCSCFLLIAFISVIYLPKISKSPRLSLEKGLVDFFSQVINGYLFIKNHPKIIYPLFLLIGLEVILSIISINIPAIAKDFFGSSFDQAIVIIVLFASLGALFGSFIFPRLLPQRLRKKTLIEYSLLTLSLCLFSIVLWLGIFPTSARSWLVALIAFFSGLAFIGVNIPAHTFIQEHTPKDMLGRIYGNLWFIVTIATIAPLIFSASITEFLGVKLLFLILACLTLLPLLSLRLLPL